MLQKSIKWIFVFLPLACGPFLRMAGSYEHFLTVAICAAAVGGACLALRKSEYFVAAGFVSVALLFSPFLLVTRIFLLMGFACVVTLVSVLAAFRPATFQSQNDIPS